jgi:tetratricopeptide (TPR) repeat protein
MRDRLDGGTSTEVVHLVASGYRLCRMADFAGAESLFREAIALDPDHATALSNLGWTRQMQGDHDAALALFRSALTLNPSLRIARRNLAKLLVQLGRDEESLPLWNAELDADGVAWMQNLIHTSLCAKDLTLAGRYAAISSRLRWGTSLESPCGTGFAEYFPPSIPKLRHDAEQFRYLQQQGVLGAEFTSVICAYERLAEQMTPRGAEVRCPLDSEEFRTIRHVYNRLVHVRETPRVKRALSRTWDAAAVESQYLNHPPGVVYVDDFLTCEALVELRRFCLESTVWSGNRYAHGRLGAFFQDGFNCPLLLQIGEELRETLPRVIGDRYPLRQLWGFKSGPELPADATTHADFAAVNVNFWITPDEANLDKESGGLVVYDVDAPLSWTFEIYNGRTDVIRPFLERQHSQAITIPYRANRAVIFNSDLFHGTDGVSFRRGYENLRVNITMLYGEREEEVHHRELSGPAPIAASRAWRSAAFGRARIPRLRNNYDAR